MNNYIVLDGKRYATNAADWKPVYSKPHTERRTLLGEIDITYGPSKLFAWEGEIQAPVVARGAEWGTIVNLRATLDKKLAVSMTDHEGNTNNVHCLGTFEDRSLINVWDSAVNVFYVKVRLVVS